MTELYIAWVKANPMLSAAVQFGILGTAGEIVSTKFKTGKLKVEGTALQIALKVLAWAFLGIIIKYGFIGMKGFAGALCNAELVPAFLMTGIGKAFLISGVTNVLFGPQMMLFHRYEENLIMG